jgi:hypothetical protein
MPLAVFELIVSIIVISAQVDPHYVCYVLKKSTVAVFHRLETNCVLRFTTNLCLIRIHWS